MPQNRFLNEAARLARQSPCYPSRRCEYCGQPFAPYRLKNVRFCSTLCRKRSAYEAANPHIEKACARCGSIFMPASNKAIYCSTKCNAAASRDRAKDDPGRIERRRKNGRRYSKTETYRIGQINYKARRRSAEKQGRVTVKEWNTIVARFNGRCAYCRKRRKLTMDHVKPLSKNGQHRADNIVPACRPCNSAKNNSEWVVPCP